MPSFYRFKRGQTIMLALQCVVGDPLSVSSLSVGVRATLGSVFVNPQATAIAEGIVTFYAATSVFPAFWGIVIAAADTYGMRPGRYAIGAELIIGSQVVITDPLIIIIDEPALLPAPPSQIGFGSPWVNGAPVTGNRILALKWVGPNYDASDLAFATIIGLPSPNVDALAAIVAKLVIEVAGLMGGGGGGGGTPGTLDFSQSGNPLIDAI